MLWRSMLIQDGQLYHIRRFNMKITFSILAGMLLFLAIVVAFQHNEIKACNTANVALSAKIELQNQSIAAFKKEQDDYQNKVKSLHDELNLKKRKALAEAERLEDFKAPADCLGAIRWGAEQGVALNASY